LGVFVIQFKYDFGEEMERLGLSPRLDDVRHIVCVQPHPDDFDTAFGATVAYLAESRVRITYVCVTDDAAGLLEPGLPVEERRSIRVREQELAASILGVSEVRWMGFPDAGDWSVHDVRNGLIDLYRELRPDVVLTIDPWHPYEAHQDHVRCGLAAAEAAILVDLPYVRPRRSDAEEPLGLSTVGFVIVRNPNAAADVGKYRDLKFKAIGAHASQFDAATIELMRAYDEVRGRSIGEHFGCTYSEGVRLMDTRLLHAFPGIGVHS
jgi:LmbE family N-acetylglucosaminyl deacetylase